MRNIKSALIILASILLGASSASPQGLPNIQNWTAQQGYATSIQNQINELKANLGPPPTAGNAGDFLMSNGTIANYYAMSGDISCSTTNIGDCTVTSSGSTTLLSILVANAASTGTTLNKLVKLTGAPSTGVITATTDTNNALGVCVANCGVSGAYPTATVLILGLTSCVFDGATTAGDSVTISSTTAGDCHDSGSSAPVSAPAQTLGYVLSTHGGGGTYQMFFDNVGILTAPTPNALQTLLIPHRVTTSSGALSVALGTSINQFITLHDTITLSFSTAPPDGYVVRFKLTQSNGGSHTVTWPGAVEWPSASAPTLTTTDGQADFIQCLYDATTTNYSCASVLNFTP